jgi:hypothetical protein
MHQLQPSNCPMPPWPNGAQQAGKAPSTRRQARTRRQCSANGRPTAPGGITSALTTAQRNMQAAGIPLTLSSARCSCARALSWTDCKRAMNPVNGRWKAVCRVGVAFRCCVPRIVWETYSALIKTRPRVRLLRLSHHVLSRAPGWAWAPAPGPGGPIRDRSE